LQTALGNAPGHPALTVLDSTDPGLIRATLARLALSRTLFLVSSKSGTTTEMLTLYRFFRAEVEKANPSKAGSHFVAITDPARRSRSWPRSTASAAPSSTTPASADASPRCPSSGSCRPR
jgi:glucose-6-phosphate isomerase